MDGSCLKSKIKYGGDTMAMNNFEEAGSAAAVIPKGTIINGNIDMTGRLEMYGEVNGDIKSSDRINICGNVKGNIKANDLYIKDAFIEGNIDCTQGAVVRENTVILGNIDAESLVIDGAVQGNLDIKGCVTVGEKAIIDSDIKARTLEVSNGAAINGKCSFCYADVDIKSIFPVAEEQPKQKKVDDKPADEDAAEKPAKAKTSKKS